MQRDTTATETKKAIEALGRKATIYTADLSSAEDVAKLVPKVLADGHQIRVLINCAGIQIRHACDVFPDDDFNKASLPYFPSLGPSTCWGTPLRYV
jgi:2-deoxy-D-gluconate 3-dehydrogenase